MGEKSEIKALEINTTNPDPANVGHFTRKI